MSRRPQQSHQPQRFSAARNFTQRVLNRPAQGGRRNSSGGSKSFSDLIESVVRTHVTGIEGTVVHVENGVATVSDATGTVVFDIDAERLSPGMSVRFIRTGGRFDMI